jgi:hypothetical protein
MVNECSCGCANNVRCFTCFRAARDRRRQQRSTPAGLFERLRPLRLGLPRFTARQIAHRQAMLQHLASHHG